MKHLLSLLVSVTLIFASMNAHARAPKRRTHYATKIEIDVSKLGVPPGGKFEVDEARRAIDSEFVEPLRGKYALPKAVPGSAAATLSVVVAREDFDKMLYKVKISATVPGTEPVSEVFEFVGEEYDLAKRLNERIPKVLTWLERPPPSASETNGQGPQPYEAPEAPLADTDRQRLNLFQKLGIGLGVGGVIVLVPSAVVLANRGSQVVHKGPLHEDREFRPVAKVVAISGTALGAALLLTGIGLFVHGYRTKEKKSTVRVAPVLSPSHSGVLFEARF